jgi:hypothetical protein
VKEPTTIGFGVELPPHPLSISKGTKLNNSANK